MVLVYLESKVHAEPFAIFQDEKAYDSAYDAIEAHAKEHRMFVTESVDPSPTQVESFLRDLDGHYNYKMTE